jgi:CheY-like chemotaxis protein
MIMKILITDDDSDDRMFAFLAFKKLNLAHSVEFVANGQELIDYLNECLTSKSALPDLILLDLNMPKKDGREALKEIKSDPGLNKLDIIIFSTSVSEKDKKYTLGLGARSFIVKPTNHNELVKLFSEICEELTATPGWRYSLKKTLKKENNK